MLVLRPHQEEVVEKLREGFRQGHTRQLLYAPTGFGKTEVAMSIMKSVADKFNKTAMVMDRIVLVEQTSLRLAKYGIDHGVMQSGHWRNRPQERIQVCSAQTLERRKVFPEIDLLIIDECHITRAKVTQFIRDNPNVKVIGLTATPFTKGLGDIYTHVVGATPTGNLIEKGWLAPLKVFISKEIDMTGARRIAGEWSAESATEAGIKIVGNVVAEWHKMTHEVFGKPVKSIVFCAGVEHGRELVRQFKEAGYNFVSISYKEDDEFKRITIEDFAKPDTTIHGLIATDILTRGFDVPDVLIGVSARPFSKSFSSHVQQMGRVMRPCEGKQFGLWIDHSGNYLRFQNDWNKIFYDGVTELSNESESIRKEPTEKEKRESKCPSCNVLWESKTNTCHHCGHVRQRLSNIIALSGELEEIDFFNKSYEKSQQDFYSELVYYARMKGYQQGWAAHKYKEKYKAFPRKIKPESKPITNETLAWIKSRQIAYSKAKQKMKEAA